MLARAKPTTEDSVIEYRRSAIEDIDFQSGQFDVVISSLAFHYVERFDAICWNVCRWLTEAGIFVFSVEHPTFTALAAQQWCLGPKGKRLHWPVDDCQEEGPRHTRWMADDVIKCPPNHRDLCERLNRLRIFNHRALRAGAPSRDACAATGVES